jgi:hypothetical protein
MAKQPGGLGLGCCMNFLYGNKCLCSGFAKLHDTVSQREDGKVPAYTHIGTGVILGTTLTHDDVTGDSGLSAVDLYAQAFALGVPAVLYTTFTFFVCHFL